MTSKERYPLQDAKIICSTNRSALSYNRGEEMVFTAPLPTDFAEILQKLGRQYGVNTDDFIC